VAGDTVIIESAPDELVLPRWQESNETNLRGPYIVILYNDDHHDMEEVVSQIQNATGYDIQRCIAIMVEAHTSSRAVAFSGSEEECERCAGILLQIRLQVETDRA
jgi:ATP-dependent Clp protease adapter protein ClpS